MTDNRPYVMSIAGFDPSGGAGILADIKTFEQHKVNGFGILTANTIQSDIQVDSVEWIPLDKIIAQVEVLLNRFNISYFKIGIIENAQVLSAVIANIKSSNPEAKIVWDPVLRATSGFPFFSSNTDIGEILKEVYLVTPNLPEFLQLLKNEENAYRFSQHTNIYLKGGHRESNQGTDTLYAQGNKYTFLPEVLEVSPKHGSGCILASAICANLTSGQSLMKACAKGKRYIETVLSSNSSLLSWHYND